MALRRSALAAALVLGALGLAACSADGSAPDATTVTRAPHYQYVVGLGDSYIAGEGDRWAGNTNGSSAQVDALGAFAYKAPDGSEPIPGCDQADLPEVAVDYGDVRGRNLACSGAETVTRTEGSFFKPGIDFYRKGSRVGQALALQRFARSHQVKAVVLSIGGNDFHFAAILTRCIEDFATTIGGTPAYCKDDEALASYLDAAEVAHVQLRIEGAIANIVTALRVAGQRPSSYRIIVQGYPSPIPPGDDLRYPQTLRARFTMGGCPLYDADATWANRTVLPTINKAVANAVTASGLPNITFMNVTHAFDHQRLCEDGVEQMQQTGLASWRSPGAANDLEWVNQLYVKGIPWQTQESIHPNYWGTAAERNCLRQVLRESYAASVDCERAGTAMDGLEPKMTIGHP